MERLEAGGWVASRLLGLANVLDTVNREAAVRAAGMGRQTLWLNAGVQRVHWFNADCAAGLRDEPRSGRPARSWGEALLRSVQAEFGHAERDIQAGVSLDAEGLQLD
jgi:hypothetical protein